MCAFFFCLLISLLVCLFAEPLMQLFISAGETEIIAAGVHYLRIEGAFYFGIGLLFLLYGLYRAIARPGMSVVLTVISLGTRVALAYTLSAIPAVGVTGIWMSVPIGWALAGPDRGSLLPAHQTPKFPVKHEARGGDRRPRPPMGSARNTANTLSPMNAGRM